ncbi:hypothetical protein [Haladaptatus litoreus]|uniref:hypothetical protein n=1 Tax=Haladaptatus litoreus TaxID=553468 RepID=UPI00158B6A2D|nr:hypothetical protein [Haladaptatus litoreus]
MLRNESTEIVKATFGMETRSDTNIAERLGRKKTVQGRTRQIGDAKQPREGDT